MKNYNNYMDNLGTDKEIRKKYLKNISIHGSLFAKANVLIAIDGLLMRHIKMYHMNLFYYKKCTHINIINKYGTLNTYSGFKFILQEK